MREITVTANEAGQRLDKLLAKYMREAPKSFFYKMMRKKNITLNGKKAEGNELLARGDVVKLFLSDDTILKFQGGGRENQPPEKTMEKEKAAVSGRRVAKKQQLDIIYEDEHIVLINKPAGMLSQKAKTQDVSLVEHLTEYLLDNGSITREKLQLFHPGICNRLDRNTSGIVVAGKSLLGLQTMSRLLQERSMRKYYRCIVKGTMTGHSHLKGYLAKDRVTNKVRISEQPETEEDRPIETEYTVLMLENGLSMLEVHLITGRSHQIRAHLASIGHPILGDTKYGDMRLNQFYRDSCGIRGQLLHAYRLEFPKLEGPLAYLSGKVFCAEPPAVYQKVFPAGQEQNLRIKR
ncbi:MAG: RluA family pseudouridine synthase [Lachnospiraceae bacterium]|nr:RluA family pseudouridine synthase [Lachnospiraceae bacterium]